MHNFLKREDLELYDIVQRGPKFPMAKDDNGIGTGPKIREHYNEKISRLFRRIPKLRTF